MPCSVAKNNPKKQKKKRMWKTPPCEKPSGENPSLPQLVTASQIIFLLEQVLWAGFVLFITPNNLSEALKARRSSTACRAQVH